MSDQTVRTGLPLTSGFRITAAVCLPVVEAARDGDPKALRRIFEDCAALIASGKPLPPSYREFLAESLSSAAKALEPFQAPLSGDELTKLGRALYGAFGLAKPRSPEQYVVGGRDGDEWLAAYVRVLRDDWGLKKSEAFDAVLFTVLPAGADEYQEERRARLRRQRRTRIEGFLRAHERWRKAHPLPPKVAHPVGVSPDDCQLALALLVERLRREGLPLLPIGQKPRAGAVERVTVAGLLHSEAWPGRINEETHEVSFQESWLPLVPRVLPKCRDGRYLREQPEIRRNGPVWRAWKNRSAKAQRILVELAYDDRWAELWHLLEPGIDHDPPAVEVALALAKERAKR